MKDSPAKDGLAKARPGQAMPSPKGKPGRLGMIGGRLTAALRAAGTKPIAAFGAAIGLLRNLKRWEPVTALGAAIAAGAAVFAWSQSVDTESRQISSDLLSRFNSDEMWKARLTLERYYYLLSGDKIAPADLTRLTEEYFKSFVYQKTVPASGRLADRVKFGSDREKQEDFLRQVDQSREA